MTPLPLCLPVMLSVLTSDNTLVARGQQKNSRGEIMSTYLPRYNTRCEVESEGTLCYDPVSQNFLRCQGNIWTKVYVDRQVPILAPQEPRDRQIARLTAEIASLKEEMSHYRDELPHRISSPWCDDEDSGWRLHGYQCYYNSLKRQELLSWDMARRYCQDRNSSLVSVESSSENVFVAEVTENAISWLGLRIGPTGGRIWLNDMNSGYHNLTYPVTDNSCVYIDGQTGGWHTTDCDNQKIFTCQRSCCGL